MNSFGIDCYWQWFQVAKSADIGWEEESFKIKYKKLLFWGGGGFHDQFLETIVFGGGGGVGRLLEHWRSSKTADLAKMEDLDNCRRKFGGKSINQSRVY